jgi:mRNA interferase RelE/StbE
VPHRVEIERKALKALHDLPRAEQSRISERIDALAHNPGPPGATKLTGVAGWCIRAGSYRIVYIIDDASHVVTVTLVGHRRDIYRRT